MTIEDILKTEYSEQFDDLRKHAMANSLHKYGPLAQNYPELADAIKSCLKRLDMYNETGNKECLVDASNFLMIEFMRPRHTGAHFRSTSDKESPGLVGTSIRELEQFKEDHKYE